MGFSIGVSGSGMGPRGALEGFASSDNRGKIYNPHVVRRMLAFLRPYKKRLVLAFFAMLGVTAMTLLTPYLLKIAIDQYITLGDKPGLIRISFFTAAAFVGLVGFLMHLARAVDCPAVIVYGGREHPDQSGYGANRNLFSRVPCAPCWRWNSCDYNRRCMDEITAKQVATATCALLASPPERPLPVETAIIDVAESTGGTT